MDGELAFYALTSNDTTNGKHFTNARAAAGDNNAVKDLDTFFIAFADSAMHVDDIADFKMGNTLFFGASFYQTNKILTHGYIPYFLYMHM